MSAHRLPANWVARSRIPAWCGYAITMKTRAIPRWNRSGMGYPSSKTCSGCGVVNAKLQREREWECENCGARHDRNVNAAISLRNLIAPPVMGEVLRDGRVPAVGGNAGGADCVWVNVPTP